MARFTDKMKEVGIEGSEMTAKYQGTQVDMFRWQTTKSPSGTPQVEKYYPFVPLVRYAEAFSDYLFPQAVQSEVLFPLRQIGVFGVLAKIPHRTLDFLKGRYPLTWFMDFPYKWKCWSGTS